MKGGIQIQEPGYQRRMVSDGTYLGKFIAPIHILPSIDILPLQEAIKSYRTRTGKKLSLSACLTYAWVQTLIKYPQFNARRLRNGKIAVFDEIDVFYFSISGNGNDAPIPNIIRNAGKMDVYELHEALEQIGLRTEYEVQAKHKRFLSLPFWIRKFLYKRWMNNPKTWKEYYGTTTVSISGYLKHDAPTWSLSRPFHTMNLLTGVIYDDMKFRNGEFEPSKQLCLTFTADHHVVDGLPFAKFAEEFKNQIKNRVGLDG